MYCNASVIAANIAYWIINNCNCKTFYELFAIAPPKLSSSKAIALPRISQGGIKGGKTRISN
jgi:hypothetical protein